MAPKKSASKKRKATVMPATDVRMETLRLFEASAESVLSQEAQRREREEQEEHLMVLREEHDAQVAALERATQSVKAKLTATEASLQSQQRDHERALATVRAQSDGLAVQLQTVAAERDDIKNALTRDRQQHVAESTKLRAQIAALHAAYEQERVVMREQVTAANVLVEQHHRTLVSSSETQVSSERHNQVAVDALRKELEAAVALNKTLQKAVDKAEETDRTNATLQQFLASQLEESKRSYDAEVESHQRRLAEAHEQAEQWSAKCRGLEKQTVVITAEKAEAVETTSVELRECQQLLEQVKFDTAYLNDEIATMRREYSTRVGEAEARKHEAQVTARQSVVEAEALRMKVTELESLLYRREKDHFDEVTLLQAQVVDTKTALSKAQSGAIAADIVDTDMDTQSRLEELRRLYEAREKRLMQDICSLRTAVLDMQHHLAAKEVELLVGQETSDEEITKLQVQLEAFKHTAPISA